MAKCQSECDLDDPEEMFAWMFTAGIPDPRVQEGRKYPHQPLVPPSCFGALSKMLYAMGARFHPELQKAWVKERSGPISNFEAWGTQDIEPLAAELLAEQYPERAQRIASLTPDQAKREITETSARLIANLEQLRAAREAGGGGADGGST